MQTHLKEDVKLNYSIIFSRLYWIIFEMHVDIIPFTKIYTCKMHTIFSMRILERLSDVSRIMRYILGQRRSLTESQHGRSYRFRRETFRSEQNKKLWCRSGRRKREKTEMRRCIGSYAKCESSDEFATRHLRIPPSVFLPVHFPGGSQSGIFRFDATSAFYPSTPAFRERGVLFSPRCFSSQRQFRYRGFSSKFSKPRIKRTIELCGWRGEEERERERGIETREENDGEMGKRRKTERGREPMRGSIQALFKGGNYRRRRRRICGIRWWGYSVLPPSGYDVTSRCNKHE